MSLLPFMSILHIFLSIFHLLSQFCTLFNLRHFCQSCTLFQSNTFCVNRTLFVNFTHLKKSYTLNVNLTLFSILLLISILHFLCISPHTFCQSYTFKKSYKFRVNFTLFLNIAPLKNNNLLCQFVPLLFFMYILCQSCPFLQHITFTLNRFDLMFIRRFC